MSDNLAATASANTTANTATDGVASSSYYAHGLNPAAQAADLDLGYWIFNGATRSFLLDAVCATFFGLPEGTWLTEAQVLERLTIDSIERYYRVMDSHDMGNIIFEDVRFIMGPHSGESFVINGSVLSRFPDGKVCHATGYLASTRSTYADFIAHELAGDVLYSWDSLTERLTFSESCSYLLGYEEKELPQELPGWAVLLHPDDRETLDVGMQVLITPAYGDNFEYCVRLRHKNGNYIWVIGYSVVVSRDHEGRALRMIGTLSDINLVQDNFENIKQMLYTDTLTGLHNRYYFQHNMTRWQDSLSQPLSVIYADVTGLKITNDVLGHADGDILLLSVTEVLTTVVTRTREIMRLAGDEFLVVMPRCAQSELQAIVAQLNAFVVNHNRIPDVMPVFVGFGGATLGEVERDNLKMCIERADVRMQQAKEQQREHNYAQLKAYLEKRKGRPVSMRDGRRLSYMTPQEREQMHRRQ